MFARRPGKKTQNLAPYSRHGLASRYPARPPRQVRRRARRPLARSKPMRTLHDLGYDTNAPIEIVNWTNEEGARFVPPRCWRPACSPACSPPESLMRAPIATAKPSAMNWQRIGYRGPGARWRAQVFGDVRICTSSKARSWKPKAPDDRPVVQGVQGTALVRGHHLGSGGTAPGRRRCRCARMRCLGAARMIERIDAIANEHAPDAVRRRPA